MPILETWLSKQFGLEQVQYIETAAHGHLLQGKKQGKAFELLVVTSGHVWMRRPGERSWTTTGVYAPDRVQH